MASAGPILMVGGIVMLAGVGIYFATRPAKAAAPGGGGGMTIVDSSGNHVSQIKTGTLYVVRVPVTNPNPSYTKMSVILTAEVGGANILSERDEHQFAPQETYVFALALGAASPGNGLVTAQIFDSSGNLFSEFNLPLTVI